MLLFPALSYLSAAKNLFFSLSYGDSSVASLPQAGNIMILLGYNYFFKNTPSLGGGWGGEMLVFGFLSPIK